MNYLRVYCNLIRKFKIRDNTNPLTEFYEKHHVFPKSIFGDNDNIVKVTYKEHFVLHHLLMNCCIQRYGVDNWKTKKMCHAFHRMVYSKHNTNVSAVQYAIARKAMKIAKTGTKRPDMCGKSYFGASEDTIECIKLKIRQTRLGKKINYPKIRKPLSNRTQEVFDKISSSRKQTINRFVEMSDEQFDNWINKQNKYTKRLTPNSNVTRVLIARKIPLCHYYNKNDFDIKWFKKKCNVLYFYGSMI